MKKCFIALSGGTVLLFGLILVVLPGPGTPVVLVGLAILATQFLWARRAVRRAVRRTKGAVAKARRKSGLAALLRRHRKGSGAAKTADPPCSGGNATKTTGKPFPNQPTPAAIP